MDQQTILVIGATGTVGAPVAKQLYDDGYHVRLLVRDSLRAMSQFGSGFTYIQGSVEERDTIKQALSGCNGVHISLQGGPKAADVERVEYVGAMRIIELAAQQHIAHITYVSGMFVGAESHSAVMDDRAKSQIEQALRESSIPSTIFRPTYFMDNLPKHLQGKRAMLLGNQPHPLHMVAASDFGRMVSRAYKEPEALNKTFSVQGPEALTMEEALRLYCSLLHPEAKVTTMSLWSMSVLDMLFLGQKMRRTIQTMRVLQKVGEIGDPAEAHRILGAPTTTVRAWCEWQRTQVSGKQAAFVDQTNPPVHRGGEA